MTEDRSNSDSWIRRLEWATCLKPWNTEIDAISSLWVEGYLSREDAEAEIGVLRRSITEVAGMVSGNASDPNAVNKMRDDVLGELRILERAISLSKEESGKWERWELLKSSLSAQSRHLPPLL